MNTADFTDTVLARMRAVMPAAVTTSDGLPTITPDGNYCYVTFDPGTGMRPRYQGKTTEDDRTVYVVCVGRDRDGMRRVSDWCRAALTDWRPAGTASDALYELPSGPDLTDGPPGDERYSLTLMFRTTTPRS